MDEIELDKQKTILKLKNEMQTLKFDQDLKMEKIQESNEKLIEEAENKFKFQIENINSINEKMIEYIKDRYSIDFIYLQHKFNLSSEEQIKKEHDALTNKNIFEISSIKNDLIELLTTKNFENFEEKNNQLRRELKNNIENFEIKKKIVLNMILVE